MKNICFIGAFDKLDLILYISKILKSLLLIADVPKWKADLMFFAVNSYQSVFCKW